MKRTYNIILTVLWIALIIVGSLIVNKYYNNYLNEKRIKETIEQIENGLNNLLEEEVLESEYNGYSIDGIIEIPEINIKYPIINKTNEETMKISVTKFWGPNINEIGNYTIAGHNNRDGTMFGKTKNLKIGDIIKITDLKNKVIYYKIFDIYSVDSNDVSIVQSVNPNVKEITLITCTNGNRNRLIIKAQEDNI